MKRIYAASSFYFLIYIIFFAIFGFCETSLREYAIYELRLSITSMIYNPYRAVSNYIDHIFGFKAQNFDIINSIHRIEKTSQNDLTLQMKSIINSTIIHRNQKCSVELLGFLMPNKFTKNSINYDEISSNIGYGHLQVFSDDDILDIHCVYKILNDPHVEIKDGFRNYVPVVFYCPCNNPNTCNIIVHRRGAELDMKMTVYSFDLSTVWNTTLNGPFHLQYAKPEREKMRANQNYVSPPSNHYEPSIGVCMVMPYSPYREDTEAYYSSLLFQFMNHYLNLGFRVFVYDQDGIMLDIAELHGYHIHQQISPLLRYNLVYTNETILGLIFPNLIQRQKYDETIQTERMRNIRYVTDQNKRLTVTHCRYEAKAVYGLERVLVVDYNEFLYLPYAKSTYNNQKKELHHLLRVYESMGMEQITIKHRKLLNSAKLTDCIADQVNRKSSYFACYGPHEWGATMKTYKSFYLRHVCPNTGLTKSCPLSNESPKLSDCDCYSYNAEEDDMVLIEVKNWTDHEFRDISRNLPSIKKSSLNDMNEINLMILHRHQSTERQKGSSHSNN